MSADGGKPFDLDRQNLTMMLERFIKNRGAKFVAECLEEATGNHMGHTLAETLDRFDAEMQKFGKVAEGEL